MGADQQVSEEPLTLDLSDIDAGMLPVVGGKAASLGELIRAQLPVPVGFCLTTEAYRQVAAGTGIEAVLVELAATPASDTAALARLAEQARSLLLAAPVPGSIREAVLSGYAQLSAETVHTPETAIPVAVRSSATAEDLPSASFAGQQDTYLNVFGPEAVLDAVLRCWASLWTDRAVTYRAANGVDHRSVQLAVVVQRMVDAQVAGVMFTANPVTGKRRETVIDASPGLGESVVSGAVNPDHFVVDTDTGTIVESTLGDNGDKRTTVRQASGSGSEHVELAACLTNSQVRQLTALGHQVEEHYKSPQDTEWAIDAGGKIWLTQARPITTLYPLPAVTDEGLRVYLSVNVAQGVLRPLTPMGIAAFRLIASSGARLAGVSIPDPLAGPDYFTEAGGRMFVDLTGFIRSRAGRAYLAQVLPVGEARSAAVLGNLTADPRLSVTHHWKPALKGALHVLQFVGRTHLPSRLTRALIRPDKAIRRTEQVGEQLTQGLELPETATAAERLDHVERIIKVIYPAIAATLAPAAAGYAMLGLATALTKGLDEPGELQSVLRGLPNNPTTTMDLALWELATRIRDDEGAAQAFRDESTEELRRRFQAGSLPPVAQQAITAFLDRYGHRAVAEIDLGVPRWSEDPSHILGALANYLGLEDPERAPSTQFARGAADAESAVAALTRKARSRGQLRGKLVGFALRRTRALAGLRELPKYQLVTALAGARRHLAAIGAELAAQRRLTTADDVFFLNLREARAALDGADLRDLAAKRRTAYEEELRRRHVPRILLSDGTEPEALLTTAQTALKGTATDNVLTGTPASAGTVTGPARVILDPVGAHLEPGEILVAPSADPGWTPLFLTAGGLVMEMGGAISHGAVVAREYGIPAVVGVADATGRITTGQQITVDGLAGTITLAS